MKQEANELFELSRSNWEEIEKELTAVFKTSAKLGPRKSLLKIGEKSGFMSICCLLRPDWTGTQEEREILPSKIVYKFSNSGVLEAVAEEMLKCKVNEEVIHDAMTKSNNVEGLFYSLLTPTTADWMHVPGPVCYKEIQKNGDVGHVMMEHVEGTSFDCYEYCSIPEVEQIIHSIARLQCLSFEESLEHEMEFYWNPWKTIGLCVLTHEVARTVLKDIPGDYGVEFEPLTRKISFALDKMYDLDAPIRELREISPVLVHGDIWQSNLMWSYGRDRPRQLKSILDWQSAHIGSPAEDIVYLLCCVLEGEDRRTHWRSLLHLLYQSLEREMAPAKPSFSFEELLASYTRLFPVLGVIVLIRFAVIFKYSIEKFSTEDQRKFKERMSRKLLFLAEDVVASFERSMYSSAKMRISRTRSAQA